jgi:hypothetical protein
VHAISPLSVQEQVLHPSEAGNDPFLALPFSSKQSVLVEAVLFADILLLFDSLQLVMRIIAKRIENFMLMAVVSIWDVHLYRRPLLMGHRLKSYQVFAEYRRASFYQRWCRRLE